MKILVCELFTFDSEDDFLPWTTCVVNAPFLWSDKKKQKLLNYIWHWTINQNGHEVHTEKYKNIDVAL